MHILIQSWCCLFEAVGNESLWKLVLCTHWWNENWDWVLYTQSYNSHPYCKWNDQRCVLSEEFYRLCLKLWCLWYWLQNSCWPQWGQTTKLSLRAGEPRNFEELTANPDILVLLMAARRWGLPHREPKLHCIQNFTLHQSEFHQVRGPLSQEAWNTWEKWEM